MAEEKTARVPQYRVILQALEERIRSGAFSFDEPLCTESALMAEFGSSRITVRRALEELENKGFITRKRGIGCFVSRTAYESLRTDEPEAICSHDKPAVYALLCPQAWDRSARQALFDGACEVLDAQEAHAMLYLTSDRSEERPAALLTRLAGMDIAGAAIACEEPETLLTEMNRLLLQNKAVLTFGGASTLPHISSVYMDRVRAAEALVAHLTALGHTRIAWFGDAQERGMAECLLALTAHGLAVTGDLTGHAGDAGALRRCIAAGAAGATGAAGASAIIAQNAAVLHQLARELTVLGLHVPGNMSLCCMEDCPPLPALRKGEPVRSVTCMQLDYAELGRRIARRLLKLRGAVIVPAQQDVLCAALSVGTTTAARTIIQSIISKERGI